MNHRIFERTWRFRKLSGSMLVSVSVATLQRSPLGVWASGAVKTRWLPEVPTWSQVIGGRAASVGWARSASSPSPSQPACASCNCAASSDSPRTQNPSRGCVRVGVPGVVVRRSFGRLQPAPSDGGTTEMRAQRERSVANTRDDPALVRCAEACPLQKGPTRNRSKHTQTTRPEIK